MCNVEKCYKLFTGGSEEKVARMRNWMGIGGLAAPIFFLKSAIAVKEFQSQGAMFKRAKASEDVEDVHPDVVSRKSVLGSGVGAKHARQRSAMQRYHH